MFYRLGNFDDRLQESPWKTAEPVNMALVAENRKVMELCKANENKCFGGFVRFRDNDVILQMKTHFEMGMAFHGGTDSDLDNLEYIILPGDEDWKKARDAHAEQFVVKK